MRVPEETVIEPNQASEQALAEALRGDSAEALAELFDRHADRIHAHCLRLTGHRADAEDATASTFLEVWRHRGRVQLHDGSAVPWLYGVATNVCRNLTRGQRRHLRATASLPDPAPEHDHADAVVDRLDAEQRARQVLTEVAGLPRREQDVLALVVWSRMSYEQAAVALGVPVGTVRSRLSRARARLGAASTSEGRTP